MTGHLVLSTLHTNTAVGSVTRLIDMGVERYLLAPMLVGLVAQRLVRRLCPGLPQTPDTATAADADLIDGLTVGDALWRACGCRDLPRARATGAVGDLRGDRGDAGDWKR